MVGVAGVATTAGAIKERGILGSILGGIGAGMMIQAITNQSMREIIAEKPRKAA